MLRPSLPLPSGLVLAILAIGLVTGSGAHPAPVAAALAAQAAAQAASDTALTGRVVAVGIPGVGAVAAVGTFHPGGPIHDKPEFAIFTTPGQILDPERIVVTSSSNFGTPAAQADRPGGAVLSLDPRGTDPLVIPPNFATAANQASTLNGQVRLFTAASPAFLNEAYTPGAVTAELPTVSSPTGISINNAFGRLWFTSAPAGASGAGMVSVVDPDGRPLADAPDRTAGGVFSGEDTNRTPQLIPGGLSTGALANALLGKSPDGSGRAVFAAVNADGSVVQVQVEQGVDGLAPAGTIHPITALPSAGAWRTGMLFNWVPNEILYVADPQDNALVALTIVDDGTVFHVDQTRRIAVPELQMPVDLAPAVPEIANPGFASNTTLAGGSDIYVANRGNGTIVRLTQDGAVVATRQIVVPGLGVLGSGRLNGIAVAADASRIWVTVSGPQPDFGDVEGAVVELPAFGAPAPGAAAPAAPVADAAAQQIAAGAAFFTTTFTPAEGLGPLYNAPS